MTGLCPDAEPKPITFESSQAPQQLATLLLYQITIKSCTVLVRIKPACCIRRQLMLERARIFLYFFAVLYAVFLYFCIYLVMKEGIRHDNVPLHKANQMCGLCLNQSVTGRSVFAVYRIQSAFFCPMQFRFFPQKTNKLGAIWRLRIIVQ